MSGLHAAQAELLLAVVLAVGATLKLQAMGRGSVTWSGLLLCIAVLMVAVLLFLSGVDDVMRYV